MVKSIPEWAKHFQVVLFSTCRDRLNPRFKTLYDYIEAITLSQTSLPACKEDAPAWALCNNTGASDGTPNGLIQLDFDNVQDVHGLKAALSAYGGILFTAKTFSGRGVVALAYAGEAALRPVDVEKYIYVPLTEYLAAEGFEPGEAFKLDRACNKPCQLRFESRDPEAFIQDEFSPISVDLESDTPLYGHPICALAECFRPGDAVSPAALASAISSAASVVDVSSRLYAGAKAYPARSFVVLIGEPGTRKTTALDTVQDAVSACGTVVTDPKNAPTLRDSIKRCGTDKVLVTETDAAGKAKVVEKMVERSGRPADPLLVVIDEAGQILKSRVLDESCGSMGAMLRKCNSDRITIEAIKGQEKDCGSYRVPANVTALLATTPAQWADYIAYVPQDNGETRRMIELWQPSPARDMFAKDCDSPDVEAAVDALLQAREMSCVWKDAGLTFMPEQNAHGAFRFVKAALMARGIDAPSADSLIMCYSTLLAAFRASHDGRTAITASDLSAAARILWRVMDTREAIREYAAKASETKQKPEAEVWAEIRGWIEKAPRRDKVREKIARRPPVYARLLNQAVANGSIVSEKDAASGKYVLRFASGLEIENATEKATAPTASKNAQCCESGGRTGAPKRYEECNDAERENRVLAYIRKFRESEPLEEGRRNIALNKLCFDMQKAGMWDGIAKQIYSVISSNAGLSEREIRSLMRDRRIKK